MINIEDNNNDNDIILNECVNAIIMRKFLDIIKNNN